MSRRKEGGGGGGGRCHTSVLHITAYILCHNVIDTNIESHRYIIFMSNVLRDIEIVLSFKWFLERFFLKIQFAYYITYLIIKTYFFLDPIT